MKGFNLRKSHAYDRRFTSMPSISVLHYLHELDILGILLTWYIFEHSEVGAEPEIFIWVATKERGVAATGAVSGPCRTSTKRSSRSS